jgi:hypothetical protein
MENISLISNKPSLRMHLICLKLKTDRNFTIFTSTPLQKSKILLTMSWEIRTREFFFKVA